MGPAARAGTIAKVTVRGEDFEVIRTLDSERDLAAFRALWATLVEVDPGSWTPPDRRHVKLDIQWIERGGRMHNSRWFYFPGGYVKLLAIWRAIWVAPLYRSPSLATFEALLGADPS